MHFTLQSVVAKSWVLVVREVKINTINHTLANIYLTPSECHYSFNIKIHHWQCRTLKLTKSCDSVEKPLSTGVPVTLPIITLAILAIGAGHQWKATTCHWSYKYMNFTSNKQQIMHFCMSHIYTVYVIVSHGAIETKKFSLYFLSWTFTLFYVYLLVSYSIHYDMD